MPSITKIEEPALTSESKASLPYPTFSKAHSKEAVRPPVDILSPPATDFNVSKDKLSNTTTAEAPNPPPSPPLTEESAGWWKAGNGKPVSVETVAEEDKASTLSSRLKARLRTGTSRSNGHMRSSSELGSNGSPTKVQPGDRAHIPLRNRNMNDKQRSISQPMRTASPVTETTASQVETNVSSDATSIAPEQPNIQRPGSKVPSAAVYNDVQPHVPSLPGSSASRQQTPYEIVIEQQTPAPSATPAFAGPPPPPPPPEVPVAVPKVDYLLQYGGLSQTIAKSLLLAGKPMAIQQASASPGQNPTIVANLFQPYNHLLDDFEKVVTKNGSLAVATGYRSVARRLLDRLEAVFARDISSETCQCCMCEWDNQQAADSRGVSWGEILELVAGRRDLPHWPPFSFSTSAVGLGISLEFNTPMQKLDIDVPEEYREHYIRQSRKTKQSVDKWLNRQGDDPSSPQVEVDDETLTFAIETRLPAEQRPLFKGLLGIVDKPIEPPRRAPSPERDGTVKPAPTPPPRPRQEHIVTASQAIQRLYRLSVPPKDPETAVYMLNNPALHNALATLAAVSSDEWDILISGRFDGFLRSGAEDVQDLPSQGRHTPYRPGSRGSTPSYMNGHTRKGSYPSRTTTPASMSAAYGAPIAFDEETEISTLAEIERDIYVGMEVLEDAFEALHLKAEGVRRALRERSAGLAAAAQRRRGPFEAGVEVRMGTPASTDGRWEAETDDGLGDWDGASDLAPDDSASNISSSRRRRPKRRNERRTPALIEEDDEDDVISEGTTSPRKR